MPTLDKGRMPGEKNLFCKKEEKNSAQPWENTNCEASLMPDAFPPQKNLTVAAINMSRSSHGSIFKTRKDRRGGDRKY